MLRREMHESVGYRDSTIEACSQIQTYILLFQKFREISILNVLHMVAFYLDLSICHLWLIFSVSTPSSS